jgi:hypothetical protein
MTRLSWDQSSSLLPNVQEAKEEVVEDECRDENNKTSTTTR